MSIDDLHATLTATPGWESLNAYEMTKLCCDELTQRGERIPSWTSIRNIIGKGSANDINRGKEDFRREHGLTLRKMSGFIEGVPDALALHILGFWTAAIAHVRQEFEEQVAEWQARIERAEAAAAHAEAERDLANNQAKALRGQVDGLQGAMATLQGRVDTERAAREQAERMFESHRQELSGQRDELRAALTHSQDELNSAIMRLEGVEKYTLMEIERTRTEAQDKIARIENRARRESNEYALEKTRLDGQMQTLRAQLSSVNQQSAVQEHENATLRDRLQHLKKQAEHLGSENAKLTAFLGKRISLRRRS
jgi:DNA repair exonuclease SbcCD ATPase subunit